MDLVLVPVLVLTVSMKISLAESIKDMPKLYHSILRNTSIFTKALYSLLNWIEIRCRYAH